MSGVPVEQPRSETYVQQKGWLYTLTSDKTQIVTTCPICGKEGHFYIARRHDNRDGLWDCKVCGKAGNLYSLQVELGDRIPGVSSMQDAAEADRRPTPLPDVARCHEVLMQDGEALEYLVGKRGFSMAVIQRQKLGIEMKSGKKWLVIPYFVKGTLVSAKYRTLPPAPKEFLNSHGRENRLYNEDALKSGMDEIIFTEGESDALTLLSLGIENVVAVPGANNKKAVWITQLDEADPKRIYLLYDRDKVGQRAAHDMAVRIGLDKVFNIRLPEFKTSAGDDGKDVNEWMQSGHTREDFETLKQQARPFDVAGVSNLTDVLDELQADLENRESFQPTLDTPWLSLNARFGGAEWGDLIGIIAEGKVGKTTMAMNWADYYASQGYPALIYCLEMLPKRLVRKWISYITTTDDTPGKSQITKETICRAKTIAEDRQADLLFGYTNTARADTVFETIRQTVRRYGVKVVVFDNLQLLVRSIDHSAQETSVLCKRFKELAMELKILIILIVQPNRVREGDIVGARNSMWSSAIEKDVDAMIALHRNRIAKLKAEDFTGFVETEENFEPALLVRVDLARYSPGGLTTLWFDGKLSLVREFSPDEMKSMSSPVQSGAVPVETPAAEGITV